MAPTGRTHLLVLQTLRPDLRGTKSKAVQACFAGINCTREDCWLEHPPGRSTKKILRECPNHQVDKFFASDRGSKFHTRDVKAQLQNLNFKEQLYVIEALKTADAKYRVRNPAAFVSSVITAQFDKRAAHGAFTKQTEKSHSYGPTAAMGPTALVQTVGLSTLPAK